MIDFLGTPTSSIFALFMQGDVFGHLSCQLDGELFPICSMNLSVQGFHPADTKVHGGLPVPQSTEEKVLTAQFANGLKTGTINQL